MSAQPARTLAGESHEEWARRVLAERGTPPQDVLDKVRAMAKRAGAR